MSYDLSTFTIRNKIAFLTACARGQIARKQGDKLVINETVVSNLFGTLKTNHSVGDDGYLQLLAETDKILLEHAKDSGDGPGTSSGKAANTD